MPQSARGTKVAILDAGRTHGIRLAAVCGAIFVVRKVFVRNRRNYVMLSSSDDMSAATSRSQRGKEEKYEDTPSVGGFQRGVS